MDDFDFSDELYELLQVFEKMVEQGETYFFDIDDLIDIINFYFSTANTKYLKAAIDIGLSQFPDNLLFKVNEGKYYCLINETEKGIGLLTDLEINNLTDSSILLALADIYYFDKDYTYAIKYFEKSLTVLDEIDDEISVIEQLVDCYENVGNHNKMIFYLKKLIENDIYDVDAINKIYYCYSILDIEEEGINYFFELTEKEPFNLNLWFNLGNLYYKLELYERAIEAYDYVLAIEPTYATAITKSSSAYMKLEQFQEAITFLKTLENNNTKDANVYFNIAVCYSEMNDYTQAEIYYYKALEINPSLIEANLGLVWALYKQNNFVQALKEVNKVVEVVDDISEIWNYKSMIEVNLELYEDAIFSISKRLNLHAQDFAARILLSEIYLNYKIDADLAINVLEEGLKIEPQRVEYMYRLAALCFEIGRINEAKNFLHQALATDKEKLFLLYEFNSFLSSSSEVDEIIKHYF